jgi:hypothetical protein
VFIDYDRLDEELKKLDEELEQIRRERIAQGKPPEPPVPFVPIAHAILLCERVQPLWRFIVKYAKLTHDSGQLIPVDVSQFDKYRDDLLLLTCSKGFATGFWGAGLLDCIETIERVTEAVNKGETEMLDPLFVAREIYTWLQLLNELPYSHDGTFGLDYEEKDREWAETRAELERLRTDEAAFAAEVEEYWRHYESIQHLF